MLQTKVFLVLIDGQFASEQGDIFFVLSSVCIWWRIYCHELSLHLTNIYLFDLLGLSGDKVIHTNSTVMT